MKPTVTLWTLVLAYTSTMTLALAGSREPVASSGDISSQICASPSAAAEGLCQVPQSSLWSRFAQQVGRLWGQEQQFLPSPAPEADTRRWPAYDTAMYEDDIVVRFSLHDVQERNAFLKASHTLLLDVWSVTKHFGDVRIDQRRVRDFLKLLPKQMRKPSRYYTHIDNLQRSVISTFPLQPPQADVQSDDLFFADYRTLDAIYSWMDLLHEMYPGLVEIETLGATHEERPIKAIHVSTGLDSDGRKKPQILITGGMHAREWVSVSSALYSVYSLVYAVSDGLGSEEDYLLSYLDFTFIPVVNPDGYEYSWTVDRLWRKNRQPTGFPLCPGIDIDHSFPFQWSSPADSTPCAEGFAGTEPLEALEAQVISGFLNRTAASGTHWAGYLDLHSYAQEILFPFAYTCDPPNDLENLEELGYGLAKAIRLTTGQHFDVSSACDERNRFGEYESSGGALLDFVYEEYADFGFQVKLRDTGNHGFLLPRKFIIPSGNEVHAAMKAFCEFLIKNDRNVGPS